MLEVSEEPIESRKSAHTTVPMTQGARHSPEVAAVEYRARLFRNLFFDLEQRNVRFSVHVILSLFCQVFWLISRVLIFGRVWDDFAIDNKANLLDHVPDLSRKTEKARHDQGKYWYELASDS